MNWNKIRLSPMFTKPPRSILLILGVVYLSTLQSGLSAAEPIELNIFQTGENFDELDEQLFPLGWSKTGEHLAVLAAKPNEAADERNWELRIIDLVADKSLHTETFYMTGAGGITPFWKTNETKVLSLLETFGIEYNSKSFQRHSFPALEGKYRGESYELSLTRDYGQEPLFEYRGVTRLKVTLSNQEGKSKDIIDLKYDEFYPLAAGSIGYLPNPQGNRLAVLVALTHRGYEGPPHTRRILIIGARIGEKF